ncbi:D-2-hydroxyacid dehydrogenase [Arthrobacter mangrovi]|uniref:2-hydroxyacid dehydrogenase n=1 Tax=Arthrobacter mangrovi TaxID=2966350 RepID=A0ABQ5MT89_9MICC|nr:D-2-hydroxyacid dehydrogenase [Arthrobacter mangrovi]GLB67168.1 2-hydroxyacid dehydrogenase [Arthrobacter mangrovi]
MKPRVIVVLAKDAPVRGDFALIEEVAVPVYVRTAEELCAARRDARVMLVWDLATTLIRDCGPEGLEWIQTNSIGVNAVATPEVAASKVLVTNTRGLFEQPMAEFVLASILLQAKDMRRSIENQRRRVWDQRSTLRLQGRRAAVIGAGGVGARIALLLRTVGMDVDIVGRTPRIDGGAVDGRMLGPVRGMDELPELLPEIDDLVLAAPLTDSTRGLIGARELAVMRPNAHVVNVGRGPLLDEDALLAALQSGRIGAATLDVFETEPLRADHPFWEMENVFVSPHQSADFVGWQRAAVEMFVRNLRRWQQGEQLENVVDLTGFVLDVMRCGSTAHSFATGSGQERTMCAGQN